MPRKDLTFRVFVSSTFGDMKVERDALQDIVFPKLRDYCRRREAHFQAIDLRWGVFRESALDQQTISICMAELDRCRALSPRPSFIVLLGNRYGWVPLPPKIEALEFQQLRERITDDEWAMLEFDELKPSVEQGQGNGWYRRDKNAVPEVYLLLPRLPGSEFECSERWSTEEAKLRRILQHAVDVVMPNEQEPSRQKYFQSATHQEISRGALDPTVNPPAIDHVLCYCREIDDLPEDQLAKSYRELDGGKPDRAAEDHLQGVKQALIERFANERREQHFRTYRAEWRPAITWRGAVWCKGHPRWNLNRFCDEVGTDIRQIIDEELAAFKRETDLDRETRLQMDFAKQCSVPFIGGQQALSAIENYINNRSHFPLVIHGPGGSGKTALIARAWLKRYHDEKTDNPLARFIGATPDSADLWSALRSLCTELGGRIENADDPPTDIHELIQEFHSRLRQVSRRQQVVLFLDGLDQLGQRFNAHMLEWLPEALPSNVRLIVSVLDDSAEDSCFRIAKGRWPTELHLLATLTKCEGKAILGQWLQDAGRTLTKAQRDHVLRSFQYTGSPLYLKLAFEEARRWKSFDDPPALSHEIAGLVRELLERLELSRNHGCLLTGRSLGYLAASRRGLSEDELLEVLSEDEVVMADFRRRSPESPPVDHLPIVVWARLFAELEPYISFRRTQDTTLLSFRHRQIREAVDDRYLNGDEKRATHQRLARFFETYERGQRRIEELPWQWSAAQSWEQLYRLLCDSSFFAAAWKTARYDVKRYWVELEASSPFRLAQAYQDIIEAPHKHVASAWQAAQLFEDAGHRIQSFSLWTALVDYYRATGDAQQLQGSIGNLANHHLFRGNHETALRLYSEQASICRGLNDDIGTANALGNAAVVWKNRGELKKALELSEEQVRISHHADHRKGILAAHGNRGVTLWASGRLDQAMDEFKEQERLSLSWDDLAGVAVALINQAGVFTQRAELPRAEQRYNRAEQICRSSLDLNGLQRCLSGRGHLLRAIGDADGAMELYRQAEQICRRIDNSPERYASVGNQAQLLYQRGQLEKALETFEELEVAFSNAGMMLDLANALGDQANIHRDLENYDRAMALYGRAAELYHRLEHPAGLQIVLGEQAPILAARNKLDEALKLLEEKERICKQLGNIQGGIFAVANQGRLLIEYGTTPERRRRGESLCDHAILMAEKRGLTSLASLIRSLLR